MNKLERAQSIVGTSKGRPADEFYPTPEYATQALLDKEKFPENIWEPACGDGAISKVLINNGYSVESTDLYNHGYGKPDNDFLKQRYIWIDYAIITNPPFKLASEFLRHAYYDLEDCVKISLFCKLAFLEGITRSKLLEETHLTRVWVFRKRVTLYREGITMKNSGMIAFAWCVWEKGYDGQPILGWI
jgi:uncharacterized protein Usg